MEMERGVAAHVAVYSPLTSWHGDEVDAAAAPMQDGRAHLTSDLKAHWPNHPVGCHTHFPVALPVLVQLRAQLKVAPAPRMDA